MNKIFAFLVLLLLPLGARAQSYRAVGRLSSSRSADDLAVTPRMYGVSGASIQTNLYLQNLRMGQSPRVWKVDQWGYIGNVLGNKLEDPFWRTTWPTATMTGASLTINVMDPDSLEVLDTGPYQLDVVSNTAALAKAIQILAIGDSTTAGGEWVTQVLARCSANPSGVQVTFSGTHGTPPARHEGQGGWTVSRYYDPGTTYYAANPFVENDGDKFNASFYLTDTGETQPDVVIWHLGINDVFGSSTDSAAETVMDTFLQELKEMIGTVENPAVGSWLDVSDGIKHLICVPIMPVGDLDGFGANYANQYQLQRYRRNIGICQRRIIEEFASSEGDGIYLIPLNVAVDPYFSQQRAGSVVANEHTSETLDRHSNGVHPGSPGYKQMGDMIWMALNVLQVNETLVP